MFMMTLPDLTHVEVRNRKAARTPKKTCPKCKIQVPVARQRCENCPHQFISNAAPDREARKAARKEKKRLRAHRDGIQAADVLRQGIIRFCVFCVMDVFFNVHKKIESDPLTSLSIIGTCPM